jgi:hypothetical protein
MRQIDQAVAGGIWSGRARVCQSPRRRSASEADMRLGAGGGGSAGFGSSALSFLGFGAWRSGKTWSTNIVIESFASRSDGW